MWAVSYFIGLQSNAIINMKLPTHQVNRLKELSMVVDHVSQLNLLKWNFNLYVKRE